MRQRVYDKWLILIFKGVLGLFSRRVVLALCSPVLHIQRCFGVVLAWGCSCFIQPCSSYSKVFWVALAWIALALCSPVLHIQRRFWAALAWIALALCSPVLHTQRCFWVALALVALALCSPVLHTQRCFGVALARVALALCSSVLHAQRCFWVALAWIVLALCSPVLHIQRCFWRLRRGVRPAFMQFLQHLMMPLVADVQRLSWQTGRHLAMSALPMSAGISRRIMLFLYLPWSGGHFKPGVSCYLLVILLFRQFIFFNSELEGVFAHSLFFFHFNKQ